MYELLIGYHNLSIPYYKFNPSDMSLSMVKIYILFMCQLLIEFNIFIWIHHKYLKMLKYMNVLVYSAPAYCLIPPPNGMKLLDTTDGSRSLFH